VGANKFNSVSVAITKTIGRLLKRGLVEPCLYHFECEPRKGRQYDFERRYFSEWGLVLSAAGKAYAQAALRLTPTDSGETVDDREQVIGYATGKSFPGLAVKKFIESRQADQERFAALLQLTG
jgi:hypothetical protein